MEQFTLGKIYEHIYISMSPSTTLMVFQLQRASDGVQIIFIIALLPFSWLATQGTQGKQYLRGQNTRE